jgi:2-amino-4-hydroxy-6-hydroxymethyldihydropteridine diphosphokinase
VTEALVGLGGNLGDVRATLDEAIRRFADGSDVELTRRSSDYRTPPWGVTDQPPFVNCVIAVETALSPQALLTRALDVERTLGRDRSREQRWGPRTIDVDLLAYGDAKLAEPDLTLPHPRLFERAFVLVPLAEIVPDRLIAGRRLRDAAAQVDGAGIQKLPPRRSG